MSSRQRQMPLRKGPRTHLEDILVIVKKITGEEVSRTLEPQRRIMHRMDGQDWVRRGNSKCVVQRDASGNAFVEVIVRDVRVFTREEIAALEKA